MSRLFNSVSFQRPKLNKFDLSHEKKLSLNMGDLVPIMCEEVLPGERFRVNSELLMRVAPLLSPMMHRVNIDVHFFFCPDRILWTQFEDHITGGKDGTLAPSPPYMNVLEATKNYTAPGTLMDYMGVPVMNPAVVVTPTSINVLPFRAYQTIYNEYYVDNDLGNAQNISLASGDMNVIPGELDRLLTMRKRAWEKDYFTSARPWAQRGGAVGIPIAGDGDVTYKNISDYKDSGSGAPTNGPAGVLNVNAGQMVGSGGPTRVENISDVVLNNASVQVAQLRRAVRLQEWLEKNAVGGYRYIEQNLIHFGVKSSDARLQRPEFLGGGRQSLVVSEVLSTFEAETGGPPQGNMAGHGIGVGAMGFSRSFEEHGWIIGIMSVLPRTAYQQGLHRKFFRFDKFDRYWPEFAHIGEQEIKVKEVYADVSAVNTLEETFGYQSRNAEYKYGCSTVHGEFKTNLAFWHMGRVFGSKPVLNASFIESDPTLRVFAVTSPAVHHLYCQIYHRVDALRPMPYFSTPSL